MSTSCLRKSVSRPLDEFRRRRHPECARKREGEIGDGEFRRHSLKRFLNLSIDSHHFWITPSCLRLRNSFFPGKTDYRRHAPSASTNRRVGLPRCAPPVGSAHVPNPAATSSCIAFSARPPSFSQRHPCWTCRTVATPPFRQSHSTRRRFSSSPSFSAVQLYQRPECLAAWVLGKREHN